jgi:DNA modification methylase
MSQIIPKKLLGDCRQTLPLLEKEQFHLCVTSPPYHGMRSYLAKGDPLKKFEIGSEQTIGRYLANLLEAFHEVRRVLRDDGTLWVNMGDRYTSGGRKFYDPDRRSMSGFVNPAAGVSRPSDPIGIGKKELCMLPFRFALAMQKNGWKLRSVCPWIKRNCMPESVFDRPATATEYWFMFTKTEKYYYDRDAVSLEASMNTHPRAAVFPRNGTRDPERGRRRIPTPKASLNIEGNKCNEDFESHLDYLVTKRNRRNSDWFLETWQGMILDEEGYPMAFLVNPKGTTIEHFASYPPRLIVPIIRSGTSEKGCCAECGAPRKRIVEKGAPDREHQKACGGEGGEYNGNSTKDFAGAGVQVAGDVKRRVLASMVERKTIRWDDTCECKAKSVPCKVLDPFSGTGCSLMVARDEGRDSTGCELNPVYWKGSDCRDGQTAINFL